METSLKEVEGIYDDVCALGGQTSAAHATTSTLSIWDKVYDSELNVTAQQLKTIGHPPPDKSSVKTLILDFNAITNWPDVIRKLPHLEHLSMFGQVDRSKASQHHKPSLSHLPDSCFTDTQSLRYLDFGNNRIGFLPSCIASQKTLKVLDLRLNDFTHFPDIICKLKNLERLVLSANRITTIPHQIGEMTSLQVLNLANNNIAVIPKSLCQLTRLKMLSLKNNRLTYLPLELYKLEKLRSVSEAGGNTPGPQASCLQTDDDDIEWGLNLQGNTSLIVPPYAICTRGVAEIFTHLRNRHEGADVELNFRNMDVNVLDGLLQNNPYVADLHLEQNGLSSLPGSITACPFINKLILDENNFSTFPLADLQMLSYLTILSLERQSNGVLSEIPENLYEHCPALTDLYLQSNTISDIPESISKLINLKVLDLSENRISSIPDGVFCLNKLELLGLGGNAISEVSEKISELTELQVLLLSKNQLKFLPESLSRMENLVCLSLRNNNLHSLPVHIDSLSKLISGVSYFTFKMEYVSKLRLSGNSIRLPPNQTDVASMPTAELFNLIRSKRENNPGLLEKHNHDIYLRYKGCSYDKITPSFLNWLGHNIGQEIDDLGTQLDVPRARMDQIKESVRDNALLRRVKVLESWFGDKVEKRVPEGDCIQELKQALIDVGRSDLADNLIF